MKNELSDAQREHLHRRCCTKSVRILTRGAAKQFYHYFTSNLSDVSLGKVSNRCQPDDSPYMNSWQ